MGRIGGQLPRISVSDDDTRPSRKKGLKVVNLPQTGHVVPSSNSTTFSFANQLDFQMVVVARSELINGNPCH